MMPLAKAYCPASNYQKNLLIRFAISRTRLLYKPAKLCKKNLTHFIQLTVKHLAVCMAFWSSKANSGQLGYLSALSGNNSDTKQDENNEINFVPAVYDVNEHDSYFVEKQAKVNQLNSELVEQLSSASYLSLKALLASEHEAANFQITKRQNLNAENRKQRKATRQAIDLQQQSNDIDAEAFKTISIDLARQSVADKKALAELKDYWQTRIDKTAEQLNVIENDIDELKKARRKLSSSLQKRLFKQYQLLNVSGEAKNLIELFKDTISPIPPAGSGDCAAPKLLQYAFIHKLTPVCMAEFWWGKQPKSEIRKHLNYYPACQGKCQPILTHMLSGIALDKNPLLENPAKELSLPIVYQDEHLVVVNKPANFLSVPGKSIEDSVYSRIKALFPDATGNFIVHRLDMATSGLLVLALSHRAHKQLQKQFIDKRIEKRYVAVVDGLLEQPTGSITLPLTLDINDRPRQMVCQQHGKYAETNWQVISQKENKTKLFLYPITGRTHQLRVHCAHPEGLNMPIVGDDLYGSSANRLHLHAQRLSFEHPITKRPLTLKLIPTFS